MSGDQVPGHDWRPRRGWPLVPELAGFEISFEVIADRAGRVERVRDAF